MAQPNGDSSKESREREISSQDSASLGRRRFLGVAGAATAAAVGFGPVSAATRQPSDTATVELVETDDGYVFDPPVVQIAKGGTVTWKWVHDAHTVTAYHSGNNKPNRVPEGTEAFDSGMLDEGQTFEHTFDTAGVYDYFCLPHESKAMVGTVVVGNPDPNGQPGLQPAQSSIPSEAQSELNRLNDEAKNLLQGSSDSQPQDKQSGDGKSQDKDQVDCDPSESNVEQHFASANEVELEQSGNEKSLEMEWDDGAVKIEIEDGETDVDVDGNVDQKTVDELVAWLEEQ